MKSIRFLFSIILCILPVYAFAQSQTETLTVPLSNPGKPYTLKVHNFSGMINLTGYDGKDIVINVTEAKSNDEDEGDNKPVRNGMKRISSSGGYELTAKEADNNVTVSSNNLEKALDLEMKIPQDVHLEAGTVNEGEVIIKNLKGEIEINNVNDNVKLSDISGSVLANTVNGNVIVSFTAVRPDATMAFSTLSGDVEVTFPPDLKAKVKMKSDQGDVYTDFDIDVDKTPAKTEKVSKPGMYQIKKDDWIYGRINGGGPELLFKTMSGDIYIKKSAK